MNMNIIWFFGQNIDNSDDEDTVKLRFSPNIMLIRNYVTLDYVDLGIIELAFTQKLSV